MVRCTIGRLFFSSLCISLGYFLCVDLLKFLRKGLQTFPQFCWVTISPRFFSGVLFWVCSFHLTFLNLSHTFLVVLLAWNDYRLVFLLGLFSVFSLFFSLFHSFGDSIFYCLYYVFCYINMPSLLIFSLTFCLLFCFFSETMTS